MSRLFGNISETHAHTNTTHVWVNPSLLRCSWFCPHYCHGNRFRLFLLGSIRTCFQWTHPKLTNCSHVTSQANQSFFFWVLSLKMRLMRKTYFEFKLIANDTTFKQEKWRCKKLSVHAIQTVFPVSLFLNVRPTSRATRLAHCHTRAWKATRTLPGSSC